MFIYFLLMSFNIKFIESMYSQMLMGFGHVGTPPFCESMCVYFYQPKDLNDIGVDH